MAASSDSFTEGLSKGAKTIQCPKCNGEMVQGFIFDRADGGQRRVSNWVEGAPEKSGFWTVTIVPQEKCIPVSLLRLPGIVCPPRICSQVMMVCSYYP